MGAATDDEKRAETAKRVENALDTATEWVGNAIAGVLAVVIIVVGLVLAGLYIGALISSPVVTLLATIAVILVLR